MKINLFGANNPSGAYFLSLCKDSQCLTWGRKMHNGKGLENHVFCDLSTPSTCEIDRLDGLIISFAPIWLLVQFLETLNSLKPSFLAGLQGIVACSSSSYLTKRFAFNRADQELAAMLNKSHERILSMANRLDIPCRIIAPSLVYGVVNGYSDKNVSHLIGTLRQLPVVLVPKSCGERQPIHASQLAKCVFHEAKMMEVTAYNSKDCSLYCLGGDETLDYVDMLRRIQTCLPLHDKGRGCIILMVPDWLFYLMVSFFLTTNQKFAEALCRMKSNLSGFIEVHRITGTNASKFPIEPLAL
jgi:hypothetical protein